MSEKKILVTGAGGYIGRHVVEVFALNGFKVLAAVRNDNITLNAEITKIDIFEDNKDIYQRLGCPDICVHLAWENGFMHNDPVHINNIHKHFNFLKCLIEGGIKHLSVLGSMHEIGYYEGCVTEDMPCKPNTLYGISKNTLNESINVLLKDNKNIFYRWLRAYYITGDDINNNSIFKKILLMEKEGKKSFPFTSGVNKYDFIDVRELAYQIMVASLETESQGIINCCSGEAVSLGEKVTEFIRENNLKIKPDFGAYPEREYDSKEIWGDNSKIKKIINNSSYLKL